MGFTVDFTEFQKMCKEYAELQAEFNGFLRSFLVEMAERIIRETILKQSGHDPKYRAYDTGAMTNAWTLGNVTGSGREISVEILNPMEYATDIEYGHRIVVGSGANKKEVGWYQGKFMMTTSIDEIQKQMPARFDSEFNAFCQRLGIKTN